MFPDAIKQLIQDFRTIHGPDECTEQSFAAAASISSMRLQAAQSHLIIPFLGIQWELLVSDLVTYSLHHTVNGTISNSTCGRVMLTKWICWLYTYLMSSNSFWNARKQEKSYGDHKTEHATIPPIT
jgi:hypothetical protein